MTPQGEQQLMTDEGFRSHVYLDTENNPTIGYGTRCQQDDFPNGISQETAKHLMEKALFQNANFLKGVSWFSGLSDPRKDVIENMCYNMGFYKLIGFTQMIRDIQAGLFESAALEMLNSKWHNQVGPRAVRLAHIMASGHYPVTQG